MNSINEIVWKIRSVRQNQIPLSIDFISRWNVLKDLFLEDVGGQESKDLEEIPFDSRRSQNHLAILAKSLQSLRVSKILKD